MSGEKNIITLIEQQKNNSSRYNIYLDGEYAFSIHQDVLIKYRLLKGRSIHPDELKEIAEEEERNRAKLAAVKYLGFRPRTGKELSHHLKKKGFADSITQETIKWCEDLGYIDDEKYAEQWIQERMNLRPRGRFLLKQELMQRGISQETTEEALNHLDSQDEEDAANYLIQKKFKLSSFDNTETLVRKVSGFLQRKGFSHEIIIRVIEQLKQRFIKDKDELK